MTGLSLLEANAITTVLAVGYVASIYVLPGGRLGLGAAGARHRNDPSVIKTRVLAVSVATTLGCLMVVSVVRNHSETIFWQGTYTLQRAAKVPHSDLVAALQNTFNRLGFTSFGPTLAYTITPLLYLGPLYALFLDAELPGQRSWTYQDHVKPLYASWVAIRNYWVVRNTSNHLYHGVYFLMVRVH
jgi:prenyl protein peptidase